MNRTGAAILHIGRRKPHEHNMSNIPSELKSVTFFVPGTPRTAGSKKAFPLWRGKGAARQFVRSVVVDSSGAEGKAWRSVIQDKARDAYGYSPPMEGPLKFAATFFILRPKGHFGKKGVRPSAPEFPITRPDVLKMARAVEDALTGIIWRDDAQIVTEIIVKRFSVHSGVYVTIDTEK